MGLGIDPLVSGNVSGEIGDNGFVQLELHFVNHGNTMARAQIEGVNPGDSFMFWRSEVLGVLGTPVDEGTSMR